MTNNEPLIDVIIPIYNVEKTIEESINSILAQTVETFRIIVIDDGSTDRSADLVRAIAQRDPRVTMLSKPNSGIVDALNMGLAHATAQYIARLDGDDIADPDRFAHQLAYLEEHDDCVAVSCNARIIDDLGNLTGRQTNFDYLSEADPNYAPSKEPNISHPFLFMRRSAVETIGRYRHVHHAEDVDLYWRLLHIGRLHNIKDLHGSYRVHPGSITGSSALNMKVGSLYAQLAAISEQRRRLGRDDLVFSSRGSNAIWKSGNISDIVCAMRNHVSHMEAEYLQIATVAKVMEWLSSREFNIPYQDYAYICKAIGKNTGSVSIENMNSVRRMQEQLAKKMLKNGNILKAVLLLGFGGISRVTKSKFSN